MKTAGSAGPVAARPSAAARGGLGAPGEARLATPCLATEAPSPRRPGRGGSLFADPGDATARIVTGGLFLGLAYRIGLDFLETGRVTGLLLLASELLVVILTVARRPASVVDRRWRARLVTAVSLLGPPLLRPAPNDPWVPDRLTAACSSVGLLVVIAGKLALGRSFGLVPAHRGVVASGPYRLVRHPIYTGYLLTHVAFLAAHPTAWNLLALGIADLALLVRMRYEEQLLARDATYRAYAERVRWRLVPGIC